MASKARRGTVSPADTRLGVGAKPRRPRAGPELPRSSASREASDASVLLGRSLCWGGAGRCERTVARPEPCCCGCGRDAAPCAAPMRSPCQCAVGRGDVLAGLPGVEAPFASAPQLKW